MRSTLLLITLLAILLASPANAEVIFEWVTVGEPGNACHPLAFIPGEPCVGAVNYTYEISKYEVTNSQYAEFLNAVAATDPNALYNPYMGTDGGITRSGISGGYSYDVIVGWEKMPVNIVSAIDALRFVNWLENGQPAGIQNDASTEDGAYLILAGRLEDGFLPRNIDATTFLTSRDEWNKAAYYDPVTSSYFHFPASSAVGTTCAMPTGTPNRANCESAVGGLTEVGSYTASASPYGTYDQGGNVWEMVDDPYYRGGEPWRIHEGGGYFQGAHWLLIGNVFGESPTFEFPTLGFRVSRLPVVVTDLIIAGSLYVDIDAAHPTAGTPVWQNDGVLGNFSEVGDTSLVDNVAGTGIPGVLFDGVDDAYIGPITTPDLEGSSDRTIEVWIYNPSVDSNEETIVAFGLRGIAGENCALNHGLSRWYGAVTHFGAAYDVPWWDPLPPAGEWLHLVYTYEEEEWLDSSGASYWVDLYINGVRNGRWNLSGGPLDTVSSTINLAVQRRSDDPTTLAFLNEGDGSQMSLSGYINTVRIHGGVLGPKEVINNFYAGPVSVPEPSALAGHAAVCATLLGLACVRRRSMAKAKATA